jgi:hypothetical protein
MLTVFFSKIKKLKMHCSKLLCTTVSKHFIGCKELKWSFVEFAALGGPN